MNPKALISYSHDSRFHEDRVLELADRLRAEGVDCSLDQYEISPVGGWPAWMARELKSANFVIIVCTETYRRRFEGDETSGIGKGAKWEGAIITQSLYESENGTQKFIPVVFSAGDKAFIPEILKGPTHYNVATEEGYKSLYRQITDQPAIPKPRLGDIVPVPPKSRRTVFPPDGESVPALAREGSPGLATTGKTGALDASIVMLVDSSGRWVLVNYSRITRQDRVVLNLRPGNAKATAFLEDVRDGRRSQLAVAWGRIAVTGQVEKISSYHGADGEEWIVEVQERPSDWQSHEVNFNGITADQMAEHRARTILLGEAMPDLGGLENAFVRRSTVLRADLSIPSLKNIYSGHPSMFLQVAKLSSVLQLHSMGIVRHINQLDFELKGNSLRVEFEGERPKFYTNVTPVVLRFSGTRKI
ncbi:MAG: SEFIR domain-containing protein [Phycisphaerae bacterium]